MLPSSQNKLFRVDHNYIKEMQIKWERFVTVRIALLPYLLDDFSESFGFS